MATLAMQMMLKAHMRQIGLKTRFSDSFGALYIKSLKYIRFSFLSKG